MLSDKFKSNKEWLFLLLFIISCCKGGEREACGRIPVGI